MHTTARTDIRNSVCFALDSCAQQTRRLHTHTIYIYRIIFFVFMAYLNVSCVCVCKFVGCGAHSMFEPARHTHLMYGVCCMKWISIVGEYSDLHCCSINIGIVSLLFFTLLHSPLNEWDIDRSLAGSMCSCEPHTVQEGYLFFISFLFPYFCSVIATHIRIYACVIVVYHTYTQHTLAHPHILLIDAIVGVGSDASTYKRKNICSVLCMMTQIFVASVMKIKHK